MERSSPAFGRRLLYLDIVATAAVFVALFLVNLAHAQQGSRDSVANFGQGHWEVYDDGTYLVCPGAIGREGQCFGHTPFLQDRTDYPLPWITLQEALDIRLNEPAAVVELTVRGHLLSVKYRRAAEMFRRPVRTAKESRGPYHLAVPRPLNMQ
jgi:hypothetical protein